MEGEELLLDLQHQLRYRAHWVLLLREVKLGRHFRPSPYRHQRADVGLPHLYPGGGVGRILARRDTLGNRDGG